MLRGCGALQIEPTDHCNLRCVMCRPQTEPGRAPHGNARKGMMDTALFRRIIDSIAADGVPFDHLILQWLGEPSLNPHLPEMLEHSLSRARGNFLYFRIDTNAVLTGEGFASRLDRIIAASPGTTTLLVFSLDAASRGTYARAKGIDAFDTVVQNIDRLFSARAALPPGAGTLNFQFQFVVQDANAHEAGAFVRHWKTRIDEGRRDGCFDEIMLKRISIGAGGPRQTAADDLYDATLRREGLDEAVGPHFALRVWKRTMWNAAPAGAGRGTQERPPCPALWKTPVVRWDGRLHVCCADTEGAIEVGSLAGATFRELWEGERMRAYRTLHARGRFDRMPLCGTCAGVGFYDLAGDEIAPYR
ncbi:MAG: SPASM domain-containing protein [Deltaproteobacteria bacterium]|nr:SPASM domain-containing protein [Deltaproteobacteria bacterium]